MNTSAIIQIIKKAKAFIIVILTAFILQGCSSAADMAVAGAVGVGSYVTFKKIKKKTAGHILNFEYFKIGEVKGWHQYRYIIEFNVDVIHGSIVVYNWDARVQQYVDSGYRKDFKVPTGVEESLLIITEFEINVPLKAEFHIKSTNKYGVTKTSVKRVDDSN